MVAGVMSGRRKALSAGVLTASGRLGHASRALVWYNRNMSANRRRSGALVGALLVFAAVLASVPQTRALLRSVAYRTGLLQKHAPLAAGQSLGRVDVVALDGSNVALAIRPGHAAVINVFTTWCSPCRQEMPALARNAPRLEQSGIDVIGVDQAESISAVRHFSREYGVQYPLYIDGDRTTATSLNARVIPTTIFVDANGIVKLIHVGPVDDADLVALSRGPRDVR